MFSRTKRIDIDKMNALIAEEILGADILRKYSEDEGRLFMVERGDYGPREVPNYFEHLWSAWSIVERVKYTDFQLRRGSKHDDWRCIISLNDTGVFSWCYGKSEAEAICLAALSAHGVTIK